MKKYFIKLILVLFCTFSLVSQDFHSLFNNKITKEELTQLENGEILIRNIGDRKKLSLTKTENENIIAVQDDIQDRNPNYLAEIIKFVPKSQDENLIDNIFNAILDVPSYVNIPYYSERNKRWYDLYDSAIINSCEGNENSKKMNFTVEMEPFGTITFDSKIEKTENSLIFTMINSNKVIYERKNITCVKPKKMYTGIVIFEYNDYYVLYGLGSINAPSIFFLKDRIETSFVGRIKYFCKYMFEKINIE